MPESLSTEIQRNVSEDVYEIVVVEPPSTRAGERQREEWRGRNIRHCILDNPSEDINAVLGFARGSLMAMVDEVAAVTPRTVEHIVAAAKLVREPLVVVPAYDVKSGLSEESYPLKKPDELFRVSQFSNVNPKGFLGGVTHARLFAFSRTTYEALDRPAPEIAELYNQMLLRRECRLIVLGGEGCFRPVAWADSSAAPPKRFTVSRQPLLYGTASGPALEFIEASIDQAYLHEAVSRSDDTSPWPLDKPQLNTVPASSARTSSTSSSTRPLISIVVVVFAMPRQAYNTIYSLSVEHQVNVIESDYEIIVVENRSNALLDEERLRGLGSNIRYFLRDEPGVSPAPAMNFGVSQARGRAVGLMIDGARMVTPRLVEHALLALEAHERPIAVVPGYHLGSDRQHVTALEGYDEAAEQELLGSVDWKSDGYRLFEIGVFDEATSNGSLNPLLEATCLFCPKVCFDEIGGVDERFDLPGGGDVNLDLFDRLCRLEQTKYIVLWGEGTFHQFHGGVSTGASGEERDTVLETFRRQYDAIRGHRYTTYERQPVLLGTCPPRGKKLLLESAKLSRFRRSMLLADGKPEWPND